MTSLSQPAIAKIEKLRAEDLEDEQAWAASFQATSADQWECLAALARQEIDAGDTVGLEDVFPVKAAGE